MTAPLPAPLERELEALVEGGYYPDAGAVLVDAVNLLFAARPDLRQAVAMRLYQAEVFSLGRAVEWSGLPIDRFKKALHEAGIERLTTEPEDLGKAVRSACELAGRQAS